MVEDVNNLKDIVSEYTSSYAMYVAQNRAICSLVDGFKPMQRRCLLAAYDLKLWSTGKFLKAAKIESNAVGDYHPHGGVELSGLIQPFTIRYPLMIGQGNWGSPDMPGSRAASRYVEAKLSKFAEDFYLESIDYADKEDNYDGRLKEVTLFYPPIPGSLLTGAQGIAIGFSTNVPTHDVKSVGNSLLNYIKNPNSDKYLDIMPDTCEESIILTPIEDIKKMYLNGEGSISYKAKIHYEIIDGKNALVVDAFPPGYSKSRLQTAYIMEQVENGNLELINESKDHIRYVFLSKDMEVLKTVEDRLTNSIGYRFYIEHRGVIKKYNLKDLYDVFIEERSSYIVRKYTDLASKLSEELSYLDVLVLFKNDRDYIKNMFDKTSTEVINDIINKYNTTESIAKRLIGTSIRSLLADNKDQILAKINEYNDTISKYKSYVQNPVGKLVEDIKVLMKSMKDDKRNALHISNMSSIKSYKYKGGKLEVNPNNYYYVGSSDNTIVKVTGLELVSGGYINDSNAIVCYGYNYYILFDNKGMVGVTSDNMDSGNKLKSDRLLGIVGTDSLEAVTVKGGNGKIQKLGDWVIRKRASYIQMSGDNEPDIEIKVNI